MALREQRRGDRRARPDGMHALDFATGAVDAARAARSARSGGAAGRRQGRPRRAVRVRHQPPHRRRSRSAGSSRSAPDGAITQLDGDVILGNGPCWSPDDRTLYHADSLRHLIYAYDYDLATGAATNRRAVLRQLAVGPDPRRRDGRCRRQPVDRDLRGRGGAVPLARRARCCARSPCRRASRRADVLRPRARPAVRADASTPRSSAASRAEADGWCYVIDGLGVRGLPEPRYRG